MQVFTDINVPLEYFQDVLKRQAIVNDGITFILKIRLRAALKHSSIAIKTASRIMLKSLPEGTLLLLRSIGSVKE